MQGSHWYHFYCLFGMTRSEIEPTSSRSRSGRSNHYAIGIGICVYSSMETSAFGLFPNYFQKILDHIISIISPTFKHFIWHFTRLKLVKKTNNSTNYIVFVNLFKLSQKKIYSNKNKKRKGAAFAKNIIFHDFLSFD